MEKEIYYTLQDIKGYRNILKLSDIDKKIELLDTKKQSEQIKSKNYNKEYNKEKLKFSLLNFLTFGQFYNLNSNVYAAKISKLKEARDNSLDDYILYKVEEQKYIEQRKKDEVKLYYYDRNFEQINMFLELLDTVSDEEKEKIFSYKMTQKSPKDDYIRIFRTIQGELFQQYNQIYDVLASNKLDKSSFILKNIQIISLIFAETSFLTYFIIEDSKMLPIIITNLLIIKNILRIIIRTIKHNVLKKDYKLLNDQLESLENMYDYFEELIDKITTINEEELEKYIKIDNLDKSNEFIKTYKIDI